MSETRIETNETVIVDGNEITGKVYYIRDNGWACVETESGRIASGPRHSPKLTTIHITYA